MTKKPQIKLGLEYNQAVALRDLIDRETTLFAKDPAVVPPRITLLRELSESLTSMV